VLEHDLQLQAGQVLSEALVDSVAKGEMPWKKSWSA
jgi:antirestriction protein ArdC